jgi:FlaA1/EpsC-like NDP-sugar epimerase
MPLSLKILVVICAAAFFLTFLLLAKRGSVKPFYSALWLLISLLMFSVAAFEKVYKSIADHLGIRDASFLIFVGAILFLLVYVLHLSVKISELSDRMQEVISTVAILDQRIREAGTAPTASVTREASPNPEQERGAS